MIAVNIYLGRQRMGGGGGVGGRVQTSLRLFLVVFVQVVKLKNVPLIVQSEKHNDVFHLSPLSTKTLKTDMMSFT